MKARYKLSDLMKRYNNLFDKIVDLDNLYLADRKARKHKARQRLIKRFDEHRDELLLQLLLTLINGEYRTSKYHTFTIYEPKERLIYRLPYYPDRIVHHAIMNIMESLWNKTFVVNTYSCIKKRGIHKAVKDIKRDLRDIEGTKYCLKLDVRKFYPSINHDILKRIVTRKIKDKRLLDLLYEIIDSTDGVPIGNYLSQYFANLFLSDFDHKMKEQYHLKYYYRYADDIVILHHDKKYLHELFYNIKDELSKLDLQIKPNYQVFELDSRGLSFAGYVFYHTHTRIRKSIKYSMFRKHSKLVKKRDITLKEYAQLMCSYIGWIKHCNGAHLLKKALLFKDMMHYYYKH